jgi:hypothetical protein
MTRDQRLLDLLTLSEVAYRNDSSHDAAAKKQSFDAAQNDLRQMTEV